MRTVVTGGAGFIGSHLVRRLLDRGREVTVADDFSRGSLQNLLDLGIEPADVGLGGPDPEIDLRDAAQAFRMLRGARAVFHLAARIGSIDYLHGSDRHELEALQANLLIDANVFRACLESNVPRLVYASSAAVYPVDLQTRSGVVLPERLIEIDRGQARGAVNPDGGYGWSKLIAELQLSWMGATRVGIARIFNCYGENQELTRAVHAVQSLIIKAERYPDEEFTVWGDGEQSRDYLYVSDCVDALLLLEEKASSPPVTVNIGSGEPTRLGSLAEKVVALSGRDIELRYDLSKPVGPLSRTADIARASALLGWRPRTGLEEGLRRTYSWVHARLAPSS